MERNADVFVNQQALHEQVGQLLDGLDLDVFATTMNMKEFLDKEWVPKDIRCAIEKSTKYSERARGKIKEIHEIFQVEKRKKTKAIVNSQMGRIERLTVFKGGLYKPPEPKVVENSIVTNFFKEWRQAQKVKPDNHDNA
ncbi:MAG: hypothetical protein ABFD75_02035 [Smithella sp.]